MGDKGRWYTFIFISSVLWLSHYFCTDHIHEHQKIDVIRANRSFYVPYKRWLIVVRVVSQLLLLLIEAVRSNEILPSATWGLLCLFQILLFSLFFWMNIAVRDIDVHVPSKESHYRVHVFVVSVLSVWCADNDMCMLSSVVCIGLCEQSSHSNWK
jgi:hypothetical protein